MYPLGTTGAQMLAHYATRFPNVEIDSTSYGLPTPRMAETRARVIATHVETIAYVRFHGRDYEQWWKGDNVTRYDYSYRDDELVPWVDRLVDLATYREVREALADLGGPECADVRSDARNSISADGRVVAGTPQELPLFDRPT